MMNAKRLLLTLLLVLAVLPSWAVLKERNMRQTLSVLRTELSSTHVEQLQRIQRFEEMNRRFGAAYSVELSHIKTSRMAEE